MFFYQIRMNEREGGVSERFSFAEDEDFVDFLLEMAFDQQHARQVQEQLSTFRQEIVERNEQLKPGAGVLSGADRASCTSWRAFAESVPRSSGRRDLAQDGLSALLSGRPAVSPT